MDNELRNKILQDIIQKMKVSMSDKMYPETMAESNDTTEQADPELSDTRLEEAKEPAAEEAMETPAEEAAEEPSEHEDEEKKLLDELMKMHGE